MKTYLNFLLIIFVILLNPVRGLSQENNKKKSVCIIPLPGGIELTDGLVTKNVTKALGLKVAPDDVKDGVLLDADQKQAILEKQFYPMLLKTVKKAIDSLDDDRTGLKAFYIALWGNDYSTNRKELDNLVLHFGKDHKTFPGDKKIETIDDAIASFSINYTWQAHYVARKSAFEIKVYQDDPLKFFLATYLKTCLDPFKALRDNGSFYTNRLKLEKDFETALAIKDLPLECKSANPSRDEQAARINSSIEDNPVYKALLQRADCQFMLLWLGGGSFRTLPFTTSAKYDWKKVFLYDKVIQQKVDSLKKCCENDPVKIEALIKAMNSGKNRFKSNGEMILSFKDRAEIYKTNAFLNDLLIPVQLDKNCCKPGYFNPYRQKWVINYDASKDYITDQPCLKPAVPQDEQVIIAVNNVTADKNVIISGTDVVITDQSKAQAALAEIGTSLSSAASSITPLASLVSSAFPVQTVPANTQVEASAGVAIQQAVGGGHLSIIPRGPKFTLTINKISFAFPEVINKRAYLDAYIRDGNVAQYDILRAAADFYLANCHPPDVDASNQDAAQESMKRLLEAFQNFLKFNKANDETIADLKMHEVILNTLLSSLDDVLVSEPDTTGSKGATSNPAYRTVLSTFDFVKAPKEKDYVITEEVKKPTKPGAAAKAVAEPAPTDSIKTNVMKGIFKVGKRYIVQVSAGIGVTLKDYSDNLPVFTGGQLSVTQKDEQVSFLVGLNFYPFQEFNLDNNFMGIKNPRVLASRWKNRLSFYTGIGIPDPLKNFYGGISDDLLPGIKLTAGAHFLVYTKYQITNNAITDQASGFKAVGPFIALNLDADFIGKLFSLFK